MAISDLYLLTKDILSLRKENLCTNAVSPDRIAILLERDQLEVVPTNIADINFKAVIRPSPGFTWSKASLCGYTNRDNHLDGCPSINGGVNGNGGFFVHKLEF